MSDALLAREAELHRRNADIDAAVASARMRLASAEAPPTPPRQHGARDDTFSTATTPLRNSGPSDPLSPSVRAAATASAARRVSESANRGGFAVTAQQRTSEIAPATLFEDVDPGLPTDIQLRMLRSQLKIARKISCGVREVFAMSTKLVHSFLLLFLCTNLWTSELLREQCLSALKKRSDKVRMKLLRNSA